MIKAVTWHIDSNNTENVFWVLGRVPRFTLDMKLHFCPFWCYFTGYKVRKRCSKETFLKWSDVYVNVYSVLRSIPSGTIDNQSEKLCFESSQIATVTNCDKSGISTVAICDLSQFVTKTVLWQIQSNNIENVFCIRRRVPMLTFDRNLRG